MPDAVLCLNSGSSSLKFAVYQVGRDERRVAGGSVERIGANDHTRTAREVFAALDAQRLEAVAAVGHRVVHGGPDLSLPQRVDDKLLTTLRRLVPLAPLHLPGEIGIIEAVARERPAIAQVVCFDTAFHRGMPESAQRLPLPRALWDDDVRRYGFHGLSYEYVLWKLGDAARGRLIIAHLGNGASLAAVRDRRPVDTTMGLTPLGGLVMGTRPGDLDPGVLLYLLREKHYDPPRLAALLNDESGLLGISGSTSDMKTLLERRDADPRAAQAVEMFCASARKQIGALAAALGGVDTLVFTGGIGERAAAVRADICRGLQYLGIELDAGRNETNADVVSAPSATCTARVVPTDEERMIARHTAAALGLS